MRQVATRLGRQARAVPLESGLACGAATIVGSGPNGRFLVAVDKDAVNDDHAQGENAK